MRSSWLTMLSSVCVLSVAVLMPRESAAQMHGVPGAPPSRMGGVIGSGAPRPMAGSSVPMVGRQGPVRPSQSFSAAPQGSRYSGRFSSSAARAAARSGGGGGGLTGGGVSQSIKAQAKNVGRGF